MKLQTTMIMTDGTSAVVSYNSYNSATIEFKGLGKILTLPVGIKATMPLIVKLFIQLKGF